MSVAMKGNWIMAQPGGPAYKVASNYTNYLELGSPGHTGHHLQARIEDGEFLIDAARSPRTAKRSVGSWTAPRRRQSASGR